MTIVLAVPRVTIGLLGGVYADRWDRKRILLVSDFVRGILVLGFLLVDSVDRLWLLYILAFVQACVGTIDNPAARQGNFAAGGPYTGLDGCQYAQPNWQIAGNGVGRGGSRSFGGHGRRLLAIVHDQCPDFLYFVCAGSVG